MKNVTSCEERYEFTPNMQRVFDDMKKRLKPHGWREGTNTGPENDGKDPVLEVFENNPDDCYGNVYAKGIVATWLESPVIIYPGDLLVGVPHPRRPIWEHFHWGLQSNDWLYDEGLYKDNAEEWHRRHDALKDRMFPANLDCMHQRQKEIFGIPVGNAAFQGLWWTGGYQGHTVPYYQKLLDLGFDGLLEEIEESVKVHGDNEVLSSCRIIVEGLSAYANLYGDEADRLAAEADNAEDKARLEKVAAVCHKVSHKKPETLHEACQLMWFYCLWDCVDCIGRYDQYMYPFYAKAKAEDEASADELISANMMKFYEHGIHNITISGVEPKTGKEATNELTYLMLHILRKFHDSHPRMTVRIGKDTPDELLELMVTLWSDGMCDPSVASDELVINSFVNNYGMPIEDARDYSLLGCQEIEIPGRSNFGCEDGAFNLLKALEYTMNNGANRFDAESKLVALPTGHIYDYDNYNDFEQAYFNTVAYLVKPWVELCNIGALVRAKNFSKLVKTVCTDDCVKRGKSLDLGGARYNYGCVETAGLAAVADSLYAIKTLVYEEKKIDPVELDKAIAANFDGYEDMRRMLEDAPKFGNDHEGVDEMARRVLEQFWKECGKYKAIRGDDPFLGASSLLESGISYGSNSWASPNGRKTGEPLSNTIGPDSGRDVNGLTSLLNSVAHLDLHRGLGGTTCNVRIPKSTTQTKEDRLKIAALIRTYLLTGGMQAQITTADVEELKDAQLHPEKHKDLLVRVGGFSIYFNQLGRGTQDEIIKRYGA